MNDDGNYSNSDVHNNDTEETAEIPELTTEELQTAINKLEDVKDCGEETREMVRQIFNLKTGRK